MDNLKRHQTEGSACVMKQATQVAQIADSSSTRATSAPLLLRGGVSGGVSVGVTPQLAPASISDPRIFIQQYKSSEVSVPAKPFPWTKVLVIGGGAAFLIFLFTQVLKPRGSTVSPQPQGMGLGGLTGALAGIGGLLIVSKSLRGEIKGWSEAIKSLDKAFGL